MSNIFNDPTETQLNERTINFQNLSVLQPTLPILDIDNVVTGQVATSAGLSLLNITSIADLRSQILENDGEEAIRLTAGDGNELNFYTNGTTASELRLQITDTTTSINNTIEADDIKVDNANKIICNTYGYRDDNTNPTYLSFDSQHAHVTAPSGLMLNGGFNIRNGNHGEIATTNGNKNLYYKTHGTGQHIFYVDDTTEIFKIAPTLITIQQPTTITGSCTASNGFIGNVVGNLTGNVVGNLTGNVVGATLNMTGKIETDDHMSSRYYRSIYFDTGIDELFNEIEMFKYAGFPSPVDVMNFTFNKTESTTGTTLLSIDNIASQITSYCDFITLADIRSQGFKTLDSGQTYQSSILINPTTIDFYTDGLVSLNGNGSKRFSIDGLSSGQAMIRNHIETTFHDNIYLNSSINLATALIPINNGYIANGYITNTYTNVIDFGSSLGDKILLYGTSYKIGISQNSIDYTTDNIHTFKVQTTQKMRIAGNIVASTNVIPNSDNTYDLGGSNNRWKDIYAGSAIINTLTTSLATGDKIYIQGSTKIYTSAGQVHYYTPDLQTLIWGNGGVKLICRTGGIDVYDPLLPDTDNVRDLGSSSKKWKEVYAGTGIINTSDRAKKKEIDYQNIDQYADELLKLKPCSYKFIDGTSDRPHTGLVAQDLQGTMFELSGAYIKDRKKKTIIEDGITKEVDEEGYNYGLRYSELISPLIRLCQKQEEQINQQQEQINKLLKRVDLLESDDPINGLSFI